MSSTGRDCTGSDRAPIFPTTDWSLVEASGLTEAAATSRLDRLLAIYLPALQRYLRITRRCSPEAAHEIVHEFVAEKLVGTRVLSGVSRERGKFRSYLLSVFQHHLIDEHRRCRVRERHRSQIDATAFEAKLHERGGADPFDLAWARSVLQEATERMRHHLLQSDRGVLWRVFEARVLMPTLQGTDPPPYEQMVDEFGFETATQACSTVVTARRMLARFVRDVISVYCDGTDASIEEELSDLRRILASAR
jgi:RNA polymerase sigma-70 factor (ECF subfamily)